MDYEKLGVFYLGRAVDPANGALLPDTILYDSKDLTTHAMCVGMTGSGKTGLCIALLEEAAIDGIPALIIDPKGDLGNLLLTFPELRPEDFLPWVEPAEAARKGLTQAELAAATAAQWRKGLAEWDQEPARIQRLRERAEIALYTPGSSAGRPLRILRSLTAPSPELRADSDLLRERVQAAASGLLALLGLETDPLKSREHILISNLLDRAWREGRDLELGALLAEIQSPPFARLGVMELESFFPARERHELALTLNHLLASPGFSAWAEGGPLDIGKLLVASDGRPKLSILSIAHLSDAERMFFVTLLLGELISWMRTQPGTSSLRALLYMDEVFGYLPPIAAPPSKAPFLTLLKQARAFGIGVVLASQNPVDLDYKALSNMGTWFLGRLQTERDKERVLDGLEGAAQSAGQGFERAEMDRLLSGLRSRVFLMNNVHEDAPQLFHSRYTLSYLRGPLTREQIRTLCAGTQSAAAGSAPATAAPKPAPAAAAPQRPLLSPEIDQVFLSAAPGAKNLVYRPALLATARLHFAEARGGVDHWQTLHVLAPLAGALAEDPWSGADALDAAPALDREPAPGASFGSIPAQATRAKSLAGFGKQLESWLYQRRKLSLFTARGLKLDSRPGEPEADFKARARLAARERRDLEVEKLRARFAPKLRTLEERKRSADHRLAREEAEHRGQKTQTAISLGATVLGALFGRKTIGAGNIGRAASAARSYDRTRRQAEDVGRAEESLENLAEQQAELERELETEIAELEGKLDALALEIEARELPCRKSDTEVTRLALAWLPE